MDGSAQQTDTMISNSAAEQPPPPPHPVAGIDNSSVTLSHGGRFIQYNIFGNIFEITAKYKPPIMPIGKGAYGIVCFSLNSETNEHVAIKKIASAFDNKIDTKRTLREIKLLRHMDHENSIVAIRDITHHHREKPLMMFILRMSLWILISIKLFARIRVYLRSTASISCIRSSVG